MKPWGVKPLKWIVPYRFLMPYYRWRFKRTKPGSPERHSMVIEYLYWCRYRRGEVFYD